MLSKNISIHASLILVHENDMLLSPNNGGREVFPGTIGITGTRARLQETTKVVASFHKLLRMRSSG